MFRFTSPLRAVAPGTRKLLLSMPISSGERRRFAQRALAYFSTGAHYNLNLNLDSTNLEDLDPDEQQTPLNQRELAELFSGRFPANFSGETIRIRTNRQKFDKLRNAFRRTSLDKRGSVALESRDDISTTSVWHKQTPLHASVIGSIWDNIAPHLNSKQFKRMSDTYISPVEDTAETDASHPDFQVRYKTPGGNQPIFALEVGFSQSSKSLEKRVRQLFRETAVRACIMVDIKETPSYNNPFTYGSEEVRNANLEKYNSEQQRTTPRRSLHVLDSNNPFSPILIHGVQWVGELTGVVQVFGKDPETGEAAEKTKKMFFYGRQAKLDSDWNEKRRKKNKQENEQKKKGNLRIEQPEQEERPVLVDDLKLNLKFSDFVPCDDTIYHREVTVDWDTMREDLTMAREDLAFYRYIKAVKGLQEGERE